MKQGHRGDIFKQVGTQKLGSNVFDLSHDIKTSFNMGQLIPTTVMDVIPGDKFKIGVENMMRFAPLVSPVMHNIDIATHYFFVPNRLIWSNWEGCITGEYEGSHPYFLNNGGIDIATLGDYMGLPTAVDNSIEINPMPFAAYNKIYDEYYRDQNLQEEVSFNLIAGNNTQVALMASGQPYKRAWEHDYFTSALPFAQKGDAVTMPIFANMDGTVVLDGQSSGNVTGTQTLVGSTGSPVLSTDVITNGGGSIASTGGTARYIDPNGTLILPAEEAGTINSLRRAFALQRWLETNARGGTRYIENIWARFGVKSSDKRLQRPEYIGGSKQKMVISEVLSTAETLNSSNATVNPVGQMAGHGISVGGGNTFTYEAEEHGWIIGIVSVRPSTGYSEGLLRKFARNDIYDYYQPEFSNIGEQEVKNTEVYALQGISQNYREGTFGYVPRYSEYKYEPSRISGLMRSNLDHWHLSRIFLDEVNLNETFIECEPDSRIFADETGQQIYAHIYNNIKAIRKMPKFAVPSI